ncbi:MAG: hypothetical protein JOZ89_09240 [Gammaproteobacteria bacterium]|nr:hypothetical protein [Gammaproteobacteria bacterium]
MAEGPLFDPQRIDPLVWLTERIGGDIVLIGKVRRPRVVRQRRRRKGLGG